MFTATVKNRLVELTDDVVWKCNLALYTSFKLGGEAEALVTVDNCSQLQGLLTFCKQEKIHYRIIGKGTNLIISDAGFRGVIVVLGKGFKEIRVVEEAEKDILVEIGAAATLTALCKYCMRYGYSGSEFSFGIPGTVGGAVIMNAGAWGGEISDIIESITLVDSGGLTVLGREELDFSYRSWNDYRNKYEDSVVAATTLKLEKTDSMRVEKECQSIMGKRKKAQPITLPNAGSFFKNPPGDSAGRLVDDCGLKGYQIGQVKVSEAHGNFFVNLGDGSSKDVVRLMEYVRCEVLKKHSIELQPEVHFI